jgi:hypothetical protein
MDHRVKPGGDEKEAHRENDAVHPPPHAARGRGTARSSLRERRVVEGARQWGNLMRWSNVAAEAPSTILRATRYGWSPSPAARGRMQKSHYAAEQEAAAAKKSHYAAEEEVAAAKTNDRSLPCRDFAAVGG